MLLFRRQGEERGLEALLLLQGESTHLCRDLTSVLALIPANDQIVMEGLIALLVIFNPTVPGWAIDTNFG